MSSRARIITTCQAGRFRQSVEANREHILSMLELALKQQPDLVCLPETCTTGGVRFQSLAEVAEPVSGPMIDAVARLARKHQSYIICPIFTQREGAYWNSAVVIDRAGAIIGIYDKLHPVTTSSDYTVFEYGVQPGQGVPVFDLDFGRVGIQICFDVGFPEQWAALATNGVRAVFWPSAYNGGMPLQVYAALHQIYVITAVQTAMARIIDPCGAVIATTDPQVNIISRDINLDYAICHYDFNYSIPDRIMAKYPGQVEIRPHWDDGLFLVEPTNPELTIAQLQAEFGFEPARQYHERHRIATRQNEEGQSFSPQHAAHGNRPMYSKTEELTITPDRQDQSSGPQDR